MKIHRKFLGSNSCRLSEEAIALASFDARGNYSGKNMVQAVLKMKKMK